MRKDVFKFMHQRFMEVPSTCIDEKIRDVVFFFKNSSISEFVVPRWSCQSHDNADFKTYDIIFYHKDQKGRNIIKKMFSDIHSEYISQYGVDYTASVNLKYVYLVCEPEWNTPYEHLQIAFPCNGNDEAIERSKSIWMKVLEEKYK